MECLQVEEKSFNKCIVRSDMKTGTVKTILRTYNGVIPLDHTVDINAKITYAVEQMLTNNKKAIVVLKDRKPVGIVFLNDALKRLGLKINENGI